jgi:hypothetical protein
MLFMTAVSLGLAACALRSALAIMFAPLALVSIFGFSALFAQGSVSVIDLLIAFGGLNAGLITALGAHLLVATRRGSA